MPSIAGPVYGMLGRPGRTRIEQWLGAAEHKFWPGIFIEAHFIFKILRLFFDCLSWHRGLVLFREFAAVARGLHFGQPCNGVELMLFFRGMLGCGGTNDYTGIDFSGAGGIDG